VHFDCFTNMMLLSVDSDGRKISSKIGHLQTYLSEFASTVQLRQGISGRVNWVIHARCTNPALKVAVSWPYRFFMVCRLAFRRLTISPPRRPEAPSQRARLLRWRPCSFFHQKQAGGKITVTPTNDAKVNSLGTK
jgi:hypothetical protein